MADIFDIENTADLPFKVKPKISQYEKLISLFKLANRAVNNDQLRAAYFRTYNLEISRNRLSAELTRGIRAGTIKRVGTGVYEITKGKK